MHSNFLLRDLGHNPKFATSARDVCCNTYIAMTMKHPRDSERIDSPIVLLGSDHSKMKRQRTISDTSETRAMESKRPCSNLIANANNVASNNTSSKDSNTYSPRMMALLSSLEALDDKEQRKVFPQWNVSSSNAPPSTPLNTSMSTNQAAAALLQQKQRYPMIAKPLTARPAIHKIEEHPPAPATANQANTNSSHSTTFSQVESRDAISGSPTMDPSALDTIKRAVAAATENAVSTSEDTTASSSLEQNRIARAAALAAVAAKSASAFTHRPAVASNTIRTQNLPLFSFAFPNMPPAATTKYDALHLNHGNRPLSTQEPTPRQLAIHNAVHSDYKKIYKPLQRPPRLPTPHEALVVAAISTATPATSICR